MSCHLCVPDLKSYAHAVVREIGKCSSVCVGVCGREFFLFYFASSRSSYPLYHHFPPELTPHGLGLSGRTTRYSVMAAKSCPEQ